MRATDGARSNTSSTIEVPTLYGRLPQHTHGPSPSVAGQSSFVASACRISTDGRSPTASAKPRQQRPVELDREHAVGPGVGQRDRERPEARADLDHLHARADPGVARDRPRQVRVEQEVLAERLGRSDRVRRRPARAPRRLPVELDVEDASAERGELCEGLGREVDDPPGSERSSVIDHHGNGAPGGAVGDRDEGAERQPGVRRGQPATTAGRTRTPRRSASWLPCRARRACRRTSTTAPTAGARRAAVR